MQITISSLSGDCFSLEISEDLELENLKALCEQESQIPPSQMVLLLNGRPLSDGKKKLNEFGVKNGDMLLLQQVTSPTNSRAGGATPNIDFSSIQVPGVRRTLQSQPQSETSSTLRDDPATIRDMIRSDPHQLSLVRQRNPPLAEALESGSLERFTSVLQEQQRDQRRRQQEQIRLLQADPFDMEAQAKIADIIRQSNVDNMLESAMEYSPESFGTVVMLYIKCKVNGHPVKAFVDSGAQMTIMSQQCAERCNVMHVVDTRFAGIAKGVGEQKIIGRVHMGQIQIEDVFLSSSFSILEHQPMDMLLGLDMLKRHQCCIDLGKNQLQIGTTGTSTPFLSESELPPHAKLNRSQSQAEDRDFTEAMQRSMDAGPSTHVASSQSTEFSQSSIDRITSSGFTREQAIAELRAKNGNVDQALMALLAKNLKM